MKPNDVLPKSMRVEPIPPGQTRTFKLTGLSEMTNRFTEKGEPRPQKPKVVHLVGKASVNDGKGGKVLIMNVVSSKPVKDGARTIMEPVHGDIWIENGQITLTADEGDKYQYLMRRPDNASNPFADKKRKKKFYLENKDDEIIKQVNAYDMLDSAIVWVREADEEELLSIANSDKLDPELKSKLVRDKGLKELRMSIRKLVDKHSAEILLASNDAKSKLQLKLYEAERWLIIHRNEASRSWYFQGAEDPFHEVKLGQDMLESLTQYVFDNQKGAEKDWDRINRKLIEMNELKL